ncbi:MAG: hypothetical protein WBF48_00575 [Halarcobacter sp.]
MAKVVLDVEDKNLSIVLNILENLKTELISNISLENNNLKNNTKSTQSNKRYISKDKYKEKLYQRKRPLEDEFLAKTTSTGRYLSPQEFKNKLKKGK